MIHPTSPWKEQALKFWRKWTDSKESQGTIKYRGNYRGEKIRAIFLPVSFLPNAVLSLRLQWFYLSMYRYSMNITWTRSREHKWKKKTGPQQPKQKGCESQKHHSFAEINICDQCAMARSRKLWSWAYCFSSRKSVTSASWQELHVKVFGQTLLGQRQVWLHPGEGSNTQAPWTRPDFSKGW